MNEPVPGQPRCIVPSNCLLGEGPVWVEREQAIYWVDIKKPRILRHVPDTGALTQWTPPLRIGSIAPRVGGGFVAATEAGFMLINPDADRYEPVCDPEAHLPDNRFNDGKLDARGRFWAGTMDDREEEARGALYRLDADLRWSRHGGGYRVTNGPTFSPDGRTLYHSDSAVQTIYRFDLSEDGELSGRRVFARFGEGDGYPDGMTADAEGFLWVAFWDGWCIRRISPEGEVVAHLAMPVQRPTSCAFGGAGLDQLFVTSATIGLDREALAAQPDAGGLFSIQTGTRALLPPPFPA